MFNCIGERKVSAVRYWAIFNIPILLQAKILFPVFAEGQKWRRKLSCWRSHALAELASCLLAQGNLPAVTPFCGVETPVENGSCSAWDQASRTRICSPSCAFDSYLRKALNIYGWCGILSSCFNLVFLFLLKIKPYCMLSTNGEIAPEWRCMLIYKSRRTIAIPPVHFPFNP